MDNPVVIAEFDNRMQAEIAVNLLHGFGIASRVWADDLGGVGPGQSFLRGVKVVVDSGDSQKAEQILGRRSAPNEDAAQ